MLYGNMVHVGKLCSALLILYLIRYSSFNPTMIHIRVHIHNRGSSVVTHSEVIFSIQSERGVLRRAVENVRGKNTA